MHLDRMEIGRLAIMLKYPADYIERRTEEIDLLGDDYYRVRVFQQVLFPPHGEKTDHSGQSDGGTDTHAIAARPTLVPLGEYAKHRLPDLKAFGPSGDQLPVLSRADRTRVLVTIFAANWSSIYYGPGGSANASDQSQYIWKQVVLRQVRELVYSTRSQAKDIPKRLRTSLQLLIGQGAASLPTDAVNGAQALLASQRFRNELDGLVHSTNLAAVLSAAPTDLRIVVVEYSERINYDLVTSKTDGFIMRWSRRIGAFVIRILTWLSLVPLIVRRYAANTSACHSLHIKANLPDSVEATRYFWLSENKQAPKSSTPDDVSCDRPVLSASFDDLGDTGESTIPDRGPAVLEAQMAPSLALAAAILTAAFILLVATFIYQEPLRKGLSDSVLAIAGAFSGVPAILTGAIAFRTDPFARRLSRGPRTLLGLLAAGAGALAATVGLRQFSAGFDSWLALSVSIYSIGVILVLLHIGIGPRFRHGTRSRIHALTSRCSPQTCRRLQVAMALLFMVLLGLGLLLSLRVEEALRFCHVFNTRFPGNVWNAVRGQPVSHHVMRKVEGVLKSRMVCVD